MDYKQLAAELLENMPLPGKARHHNGFGGIHSDMVILMHVEQKGEALPKDISDSMDVSTARVAMALNALAGKGLITREIDGDDRRRIIVRLTPGGRTFALEQKQLFVERIAGFLSELGEHDAQEYVRITARVSEIMRRECAQEFAR